MIRIILKNMDKKNYGIYGFSMALFSSIIYIIASLISINGIINLGAGSENVRIVFAFYYVVIACTGLLFIFYALNFYIKSRMKDYAMLIVLGISKGFRAASLILSGKQRTENAVARSEKALPGADGQADRISKQRKFNLLDGKEGERQACPVCGSNGTGTGFIP